MYKKFEALLKENKVTPYRVHKETGISTATLSDWKNGKSEPKKDKIEKICEYFNVPLSYFYGNDTDAEKSSLTKRDTKQIEAILSDTEALLKQEGLMFDGDPASPEAIDSILSAMKIGMEMAKQKNKEKYTPKKYKKDWFSWTLKNEWMK